MKIRYPLAFLMLALFLWSCEEPIAFENDTFLYNPFILTSDTLNTVTAMAAGGEDLEWGSHLRTWLGETRYYKSGFEVRIDFADADLDLTEIDSIILQVQHVKTYPETGTDTLAIDVLPFGLYDTKDQSIDIAANSYGTLLGSESRNITGGNNIWTFKLPDGFISTSDTTTSLGLFPQSTGYLSGLYGGGSVSLPKLLFYSHVMGSTGQDSATSVIVDADTLRMHFMEQPNVFDRSQAHFLSQLRMDSLVMSIDLTSFNTTGDTLQHIIDAKILPEIIEAASQVQKPDASLRFSMSVSEPVSGRSTTVDYGGAGSYTTNQIRALLQPAIDDGLSNIDLILKATNPGFNPGFICIAADPGLSRVYVGTSKAVHP